jgi:hypothetical protein
MKEMLIEMAAKILAMFIVFFFAATGAVFAVKWFLFLYRLI